MQAKGTYLVLNDHIHVAVSLLDTLYRLNLTAASHVHLLEPHWNPMAEAQAVNRAHRIGQSRAVRTTRYITHDSIETVSLLKPPSASEVVSDPQNMWLTSNSMCSGFKGKKYDLSINLWILSKSRKRRSTSIDGKFVTSRSKTRVSNHTNAERRNFSRM